MLLERGFNNVRQNNQIIGFQVQVKIAYYRGVFLPLIGEWEIDVDGEKFGVDKMRYTLGSRTFTFDETAKATDVHWAFGKPLKLTILKPGGLSPGVHTVYFRQIIVPPYVGGNFFTSEVTKKMAIVD
jgi:hypothetical protein